MAQLLDLKKALSVLGKAQMPATSATGLSPAVGWPLLYLQARAILYSVRVLQYNHLLPIP